MGTQNYIAKFDANGNATTDSIAFDNGIGTFRIKNPDGNNTVGLEVHMKPTLTRPGFILMDNRNAPAVDGGSMVTHYAWTGVESDPTGRTQQGAYSFSWVNANDRAAKWELWQRCPTTAGGAETLVVLKSVPEDNSGNTDSLGKAFFRFGPEPTLPSDRVHLVDGNLRLQRSSAAQKIRFFEGATEDWTIEQKTSRELAIDAPANRNLLLLSAGTGGKLGVGEASPQSRLHVKTMDAEIFRVERSGATAPGFYTFSSSAQMTGDSADLRIVCETSGTGVLVQSKDSSGALHTLGLDKNGNVGVGRADPSHPLHMSSGAHVTSGGVWTNASSRECKENICDLTTEEAIEVLSKLNPTKFNYKIDEDEKQLGFIAEDVPDFVATKDRKSLSPMNIIAVLTKVLQEQQRRIEELKNSMVYR